MSLAEGVKGIFYGFGNSAGEGVGVPFRTTGEKACVALCLIVVCLTYKRQILVLEHYKSLTSSLERQECS